MNDTNGDGRVALITGASSGIGAATALRLADEGFKVLLTARRQSHLEKLVDTIQSRGGVSGYIAADLINETERLKVYNDARSMFGVVDILINNAGLGWYGFGDEMLWTLAHEMIEVNISAVTQLTLLFLSDMKKRKRGHIINIGSIVGSLPSQGVALYSATKSFVDALTTSLYRELRGTNVRISVVRAGAVATPFYETALEKPKGMRIPVERLTIKPELVADRIWKLIQKPARIAYVPRWLGFIPWLELCLGWMIDRLGPVMLRHQRNRSSQKSQD
jgi:short-subunit dehydrogenase